MTNQEIKQRILHYKQDGETFNLLPVAGRYDYGHRLLIELIDINDGETFCILTTNLQNEELENNDTCAFVKIDWFGCKFIEKFKLGTISNNIAHSGYNSYVECKFDLDKLVEHDDVVAYFDSLEEVQG